MYINDFLKTSYLKFINYIIWIISLVTSTDNLQLSANEFLQIKQREILLNPINLYISSWIRPPPPSPSLWPVRLEREPLSWETDARFLWVLIDDNLSWESHMNNMGQNIDKRNPVPWRDSLSPWMNRNCIDFSLIDYIC